MGFFEAIIPVVAVGGFYGAIITFIYMKYRSKHLQRMALIDSGQSAEIFKEITPGDKSIALKYGMLSTGIGIGFILGVLIEQGLRWPDATAIIPMSFVGGGLGLIGYYLIMSRKEDY
ncbi:MAG: hypothetical protein HKN09_08980 [Saprospiraceae bacterium]|nr:hypothetical protein [Saprospiraceae bacterium]